MREYLFRGKIYEPCGRENGTWIIGDLLHNLKGGLKIVPSGQYGAHVDPSTVGQFTGVKDRTGLEIFEGDIVTYSLVYIASSNIDAMVIGVVEWIKEGSIRDCFRIRCSKTKSIVLDCSCRVVGNIYDNPGLVKDIIEL